VLGVAEGTYSRTYRVVSPTVVQIAGGGRVHGADRCCAPAPPRGRRNAAGALGAGHTRDPTDCHAGRGVGVALLPDTDCRAGGVHCAWRGGGGLLPETRALTLAWRRRLAPGHRLS
jgi:hypothetical protein